MQWPYGNDLYHLNSILQPATATSAPVVGIAITTEVPVPGCATGASHFIDMEAEEDKKALMERLKEIFIKDPVKTTLVEMTKLNLVEVTRKKIRKPLYEQVSQI